ncbi:unnamed protein product [Nezara viridula]|uniref:Uncharacterized protein n=1 Tax=Nezara viridula TaxID=85310 RepID=A0A9P0HU51_NEZVI|nr:unnamed protein product [Nezara viridula]
MSRYLTYSSSNGLRGLPIQLPGIWDNGICASMAYKYDIDDFLPSRSGSYGLFDCINPVCSAFRIGEDGYMERNSRPGTNQLYRFGIQSNNGNEITEAARAA